MGLVFLALASPLRAEAVRVTLRPTAEAAEARVLVADVAEVTGGPAALRLQVGRLDLAELTEAQPSQRVTREQVAFRLRLAGVERDQYRIDGAAYSTVTRRKPRWSDEDFVTSAREFLQKRIPWPPEDVTVQLARPVRVAPLEVRPEDELRFEPHLPANVIPLGQVWVEVGLFVNGARKRLVPVPLEVRLTQEVVVTTRRLERGDLLGSDNSRLERRSVDKADAYLTRAAWAQPRRARRILAAGQVVGVADVEASDKEQPVLVRAQEAVRLVVKSAGLTVTAVGEALQDGRSGQTIRVRNVDSKKVILGRVVDRSVVEVEF